MITAFIPFDPELATGALFILGAFGKVHERLILLWKVVDLSILFACEPFMRCTPAKQTVGLLARRTIILLQISLSRENGTASCCRAPTHSTAVLIHKHVQGKLIKLIDYFLVDIFLDIFNR